MKGTVKSALIATVLLLCALTTFAQQSITIEDGYGGNPYNGQSVLTLRNNTDKIMFASFVYFDPIDQCWVSRGWRTIQPYGTNQINFGVYSGSVFIHGYQPSTNLQWGHGYYFCCENKAPFRVLRANGSNCEMKREYSQVNLSSGSNEHVFNP